MKIMTPTVLWTVLVAVALAGLFFVFRNRVSQRWGFREAVQNPKDWSRDSERTRREIEKAVGESASWNNGQVSAAASRFIFEISSSEEATVELKVLRSLGTRVHSSVLTILGDSSNRARLVAPTGTNLLPEAPFNRACDLLEEPPAAAARLISPFLEEPSAGIRKDAALVLGKIGSKEVVPSLRRVFEDQDEYVRSYGLMGLRDALHGGRDHELGANDLFDDIAALLLSNKNADDAADLLVLIDAERATGLFLSPKVFDANATFLHEVLEALAKKQTPVPRDRLLRLIADLEAREIKYPITYALKEALLLLGQTKNPDDRSFLEKRTYSSETKVAEGAMAGLIASFGLEGFEERIWESEGKNGIGGLPAEQRRYLAVLILDGQVNNGGLTQYFFNSSGGQWREAEAGLEAMGFKERLQLLREAIAKFGKGGPSQEREHRQEQLSKLEQGATSAFDDLDNRYFACKAVVEVLSKRYVLKNEQAFR